MHGYINSFMFAQSFYFYKIADDYSYIIRSDTDVFLTPKFLSWVPTFDVAFTQAYYCTAFNMNRLEAIAKKLNLITQHIHCIGSTVYMTPKIAKTVGQLIINLTIHLVQNEFNPSLPGLEGMFDSGENGIWPKWWKGVSTLYATELALNHVVPNVTKGFVGPILDAQTCSNFGIDKVVHCHCYHDPCEFSKFTFMRTLISMTGTLILDPRLFKFYAERDVRNMTVKEYSTFIAWHGAGRYVTGISELVIGAESVQHVKFG